MMRKCTTDNGRFGTMAGVSRRNGSAILEVLSPPRASVSPPLRQAASTILLRSNIIIFILSNDKDEFCARILDVLEDYSNTFYISTFVLKELILLYKEEKLKHLKYKSYKEIFDSVDDLGIKIISVQRSNLSAYAELIPVADHKDPNDHLIIAQSISDNIPIISSDRKFKSYERQGLQLLFNKR
ncbi:MAG: PIN domain-containing protein [Candidatus Azobacteroides sp.]|nr:PIN domain-containing protein [Candidatus Azobacteroides sp.]